MGIELDQPCYPAPDVVAADVAAACGPQVAARLIEYAPGRHLALPPHTTYALLEHPAVVGVPGAAHYAYGLLAWQDTRLPLLDLNALLHAGSSAVRTAIPRYALVVAYQRVARGPLAFGAIGLNALPQTIEVGDTAQCELPGDSALWPQLALSCFEHEGKAIPIIDTTRLLSVCHS